MTLHNSGQDIAACAVYDVDKPRPTIEIQCNVLDFDQPQEISIQRRFFSHGGQDLALDSNLVGEVFLNVGVLRLKGWDIEIHAFDFDLDREIIRKFLELHSKAEAHALSISEREEWASIVAQVDYQRFCAERSSEIYIEGQLLGNEEGNGWRVTWHDGSEQFIPIDAGRQLALLNEGERFGAMVTFGKNREVKSLTKLSFIAAPTATSEELWKSWPTTSS